MKQDCAAKLFLPNQIVLSPGNNQAMAEIVVLLGAGASRYAGVPMATDMTLAYLNLTASTDTGRTPYADVMGFVVGGLANDAWRRGKWLFDGPEGFGVPNIEDVYNAVEMLANRESIEAAPFVDAWEPAVQNVDQSKLGEGFAVETNAGKQFVWPFDGTLLEDLKTVLAGGDATSVALAFIDATRKARNSFGGAFELTRRWMLANLATFTYLEADGAPDQVAHHRRLVQTCLKRLIPIVTLNYDNAVELACAAEAIHCDNLMRHWHSSYTIQPQNSGVELLKLHGSITWEEWPTDVPGRAERKPWENHTCDVEALRAQQCKPAVIFGRRNKLTEQGPFLDLLAHFKRRLFDCQTLHVVGYSFRDPHINELIARWLATYETRQLVIHDPSATKYVIWWQQLPSAKSFRGSVTADVQTAEEAFSSL